jgi:RNA polymerase sigma factor (sigma-70 family)
MATGQLNGVFQHLRGAMLLGGGAGLTDRQLLEDYNSRRDGAALAALVQRHGPMVWGVCRRVLSNYHDAEDAFQATFLVLVRKTASIASPELLANWLYGVAHRTAMKARATVAKRRVRERQVTEMPEPAVVEQDLWNDLQPLLDQELSRLTDIYRVVIVLCDLDGKTRKEAARHLGLPEGTVGSRLARARVMLAKRLAQRGVVLSGGALAALLAQNVASAGVPHSVVSSTISAASFFAAGQATATGLVSVKVAALAEGVLKAMMMSKLKAVVAVVLVLGFIVTGTTVLTSRIAVAQGEPPPDATKTKAPQKQEQPDKATPQARQTKEKTDLDKLQGTWEVTTFQVRGIELEGPIADQFKAIKFVFKGDQLIYDGKGEDGKAPPPQKIKLDPKKDPKHIDLTPLDAKPNTTEGVYDIQGDELRLCLAQNEQRPKAMASNKDTRDVFLILKRIAHMTKKDGEQAKDGRTGERELTPETQEQEKEKAGFTAWGEEVGGLQAGLGFRPGDKRAYSRGENVKLVVRVRNVGKQEVRFQYLRQFFIETPPAVTDGGSKPVPLGRVTAGGLVHVPVEVNLAPGKEIELAELKLEPRSSAQSVTEGAWTLFGTGKFQIQYERVFGNSSGRSIKVDPTLSKLATGKLELEIEDSETPNVEYKQPYDLPTGEEVLNALPKGQSLPQNSGIKCELVSYRLEAPKFFPNVGQAQLSTAHFKCTVKSDKADEAVVFIDKTKLIPSK